MCRSVAAALISILDDQRNLIWSNILLQGSTIMDKSLGTNSHLTRAKATVRREFIYTCSAPPPPPLQCWTSVHAISPEFQHGMGGRGGGEGEEGKATQFETENSAFVKLGFKNAEN